MWRREKGYRKVYRPERGSHSPPAHRPRIRNLSNSDTQLDNSKHFVDKSGGPGGNTYPILIKIIYKIV